MERVHNTDCEYLADDELHRPMADAAGAPPGFVLLVPVILHYNRGRHAFIAAHHNVAI